tara:strand:+ start:7287 stop:7529 length:243 start_codon:yes stop_codon:yes gene_type:complete
MSYSNAGLKLMVAGVSGGPNLWYYSTTDAHTDVDAADYFSDGATFGMKLNDAMIVYDTDTNTLTMHGVESATSINAATLA